MVSVRTIVIFAIFAVGFTAGQSTTTTTGTPPTTTTTAPSSCVYSDQLWADVNPNLYYFCNPLNNLPTQQECPSGRGFLRNGTLSGCIPFEQWPATCVTQVTAAPSCTGSNVNQPSVATNPNKFYVCLSEGATPVLLQCNNGKGFLSTSTALGCVDWPEWRELTNCNIN